MPKGYRAYVPEQDLLPPHAVYEKEMRGQPPYGPRMMTKVLVYGDCVGVFSSRRIHKRPQEDIGFKVLAAGNEPDFQVMIFAQERPEGASIRKLHGPLRQRSQRGARSCYAETAGLRTDS